MEEITDDELDPIPEGKEPEVFDLKHGLNDSPKPTEEDYEEQIESE